MKILSLLNNLKIRHKKEKKQTTEICISDLLEPLAIRTPPRVKYFNCLNNYLVKKLQKYEK